MSAEEINVKSLTIADLDLMLEAVQHVLDNAGQENIEKLLSGALKSDKEEAGKIAVDAFRICIKHARKTVFQVMANACSMSEEDFYQMSASKVIEVAKKIVYDEENRDFFYSLQDMLPKNSK